MSRGLGRIEQAILECTKNARRPANGIWSVALASSVADLLTAEHVASGGKGFWWPTTSLKSSVRRAAARLEAKGMLRSLEMPDSPGRIWWRPDAAEGSEDVAHRKRTDITRLRQLLGMMGSEHAGERANAAALAEQERARLGLTWEEILGG